MQVKQIAVVPYNAAWKHEFLKIKEHIESAVSNDIIAVEHVGSTAVEGLSAKAIIDVDIVIESYDLFHIVLQGLERIGYYHEGDLGIKGREAFGYHKEKKTEFMEHHLYVCPQDSAELNRHLTFRNHLRTNQEDRERYSNIKIEAAKKYPTDIERYLAMKGIVIAEIYERCGL